MVCNEHMVNNNNGSHTGVVLCVKMITKRLASYLKLDRTNGLITAHTNHSNPAYMYIKDCAYSNYNSEVAAQ